MLPKIIYRQPFAILFFVTFILFIVLWKTKAFPEAGIDWSVAMGGTAILYFATALSFWLSYRSINSSNPHAPIRSMYGSFMAKFFVIAVAAFIYIMAEKKQVNKPALMICMGLYLIYTFLEVTSLQKILRQKKNGKEGSPA